MLHTFFTILYQRLVNKNDGDGLSINYEWLSKHSLKISILQFSTGKTTYTITQHKNKVVNQIHTDKRTEHNKIQVSP
ncbi:unnamed protein product [Commensalibacter papalotli (ex Botero et al. 2024)]|uniref:Uncharacterized protein n=1 Tax=Commensalibacter papalotli (ex Botero et al. 2024) TaxID=2972766 RepID=A0ABM9HSV8_9PROT|nr:unnamed protein product [Commensalibacter papalotli (ex Botero et al. 2024)]CAI3953242.1 unnamed protein product [Commensalibacter papalotli (ex Botero et al. 2024)]